MINMSWHLFIYLANLLFHPGYVCHLNSLGFQSNFPFVPFIQPKHTTHNGSAGSIIMSIYDAWSAAQ